MIYVSSKKNHYNDFDWVSYLKYYTNLLDEGYTTKEQTWWHYLNIGEFNGYHFFNIHNPNEEITNNILDELTFFDYTVYSNYYPQLKNEGYETKEQLKWHYLNIGKIQGLSFFHIHQREQNMQLLKKLQEQNAENHKENIPEPHMENNPEPNTANNPEQHMENNPEPNTANIPEPDIDKNIDKNIEKKINTQSMTNKKTVYYYIDNTCRYPIRTGIQIVSIYLAREFVENEDRYKFDVIFVKWNDTEKSLVPCNTNEVEYFFNYNEKSHKILFDEYDDYQPIHLNKRRLMENSVFFCPELTFVTYQHLPKELNIYLKTYKLGSIYILYDIIPLVLPEYVFLYENFKSYVYHNLLNSDRIITISNFTKEEFLKYAEKNELYSIEFPSVISVPLPHQYRNKKRILASNNVDKKIKILLPGTVEPRKQQMKMVKLFNKFIQLHPEIDVELIIFGTVLDIYKDEFNEEIKLSMGKIIYLGIIDNETLFRLYKTSTFLCFISKYEGYGFPISESLWHGLPVLTGNFGSMAEIAKCGCYCIDTNNENEIYEALNHLIKNPILIEKLKNEINNCSLTKWCEYAEKIYKEILKEL